MIWRHIHVSGSRLGGCLQPVCSLQRFKCVIVSPESPHQSFLATTGHPMEGTLSAGVVSS